MSATAFIKMPSGVARAAKGHIPFPGHRTMATVYAQQGAARRREQAKQREMESYGFDPESLKTEGGR